MFSNQKCKYKINFRPLVIVFISLLFGLISARGIYSGDGFYIAVLLFAILVVAIYSFVNKKFFAIVAFIIFFFIGNGMFFLSLKSFQGQEYNSASISGRVCQIEFEDGKSKLLLENVTANSNGVHGVMLYVSDTIPTTFERGDILTYVGDLEHVKLFDLGSFASWNYRNDVAYTSWARIDEVDYVSGGATFDEKAREKIQEVLYNNMSPEYASVAYAVLTGGKDMVENEILNTFRDAGIIHILTVSGLHISFLSALIAWIFKKLRIKSFINFILTFCILLIYAYICSFSPSVVRAMIMGLVLISATIFGKEYDGPTSLSIAGIITLCIWPLMALDVGFLMSYGCVAGIMLLSTPIRRVLQKFLPYQVAKYLSISVGAQIGILPFLASFFSSLNLLSFWANLIVVPFFAILFPMLVVFTLVSILIPAIGAILKVIEWGLIAVKEVAIFFASTRFKIILKPFDPIALMIIFAIIFLTSYYFIALPMFKYYLIATLTLILGCFIVIKPGLSYRGTSIAVTGYGDTMVLESNSGQVAVLGYHEDNIKYYLSKEGVENINYIFTTKKGNGSEYNSLIVSEEEGYVGDFKFKIDNQIYIFEFDGVKILWTNLSSSSYNDEKITSALNEGGFDFVFAPKYNSEAKDYFLVSEAPSGDYNFNKNGSFRYAFDSRKLWRID